MDALTYQFIITFTTIVAVSSTLAYFTFGKNIPIVQKPAYGNRKPLFKPKEESLNINCRHCGADSWHGQNCSYCKLNRGEEPQVEVKNDFDRYEDAFILRQRLAALGRAGGVYLCNDKIKPGTITYLPNG